MSKSRLEAFTDGILAIIITVIVLSFQMPSGFGIEDLIAMRFSFATYASSFFIISLYWINHHDMFQIIKIIDRRVLWLNIMFLFFVSFYPFANIWVSKYFGQVIPTMFYCGVFMFANLSYCMLSKYLVKINKKEVECIELLNQNRKEEISIALSILMFVLSYYAPRLTIYGGVLICLMWMIPNRYIQSFFGLS